MKRMEIEDQVEEATHVVLEQQVSKPIFRSQQVIEACQLILNESSGAGMLMEQSALHTMKRGLGVLQTYAQKLIQKNKSQTSITSYFQ